MTLEKLSSNRAVQMLNAASTGHYGVLGVVSYNLETIVAAVRAAEAKRSPLQILLFPWALKYSPLLVDLAATAAQKASVPITVHMDHAQDPAIIREAAQLRVPVPTRDGAPTTLAPAFDSIMVDMSHHERAENLALTHELVAFCHSRGIATEAEPGRIEGGEDGVADTAALEGVMTTAEDVEEFVATGIDFLAPAVGNIHGEYGGVEKIKLDYERLGSIKTKIEGRVQLVMHGTNGFSPEIMQKCISNGVTRVNVNKLVLSEYNEYVAKNTGRVPLTQLMEEGTALIQASCEKWMDHIGSSGKA